MKDPAPDRLAAMTLDLERFATGFLDVLDRLGPEAAAGYLGGLAEWCGSDLTSSLLFVPLPLWKALDGLAAELQAACEASLAARQNGRADAGAEARVRAAAARAAALRQEWCGAGQGGGADTDAPLSDAGRAAPPAGSGPTS